MARADDKPTPRVQVYFENPKTELALRREARANRQTLSRAAESAIERGLQRRPGADPDDRLRTLELALRDHMRASARDMTILQELFVEFARAFFTRLPDNAGDQDPLVRAAVEARIDKLLDAAAARIVAAPKAALEKAAAADEPRSFMAAAE